MKKTFIYLMLAVKSCLDGTDISFPKAHGDGHRIHVSNWPALVRYVEDVELVLDNNRSERALRGIGLGRKNWLFFGSDGGGKVVAILLSLLKSAQRNGLNPFDYLTDVLTRIADHPQSKITDLLPPPLESGPRRATSHTRRLISIAHHPGYPPICVHRTGTKVKTMSNARTLRDAFDKFTAWGG